MIIAITGGSGFIGKKLVQKHLSMDDTVRVLTRNKKNESTNIEFYTGDLTDTDLDLSCFLHSVDVLYHCAGELNDEAIMYDLHVNGTSNLIKASMGNIGRWVQLSSVGAYGKSYKDTIDELNSDYPVGQYEITKTISDDMVKKSGIPYVIVRPSIVFSTSMKNKSLYSMVRFINSGLFFYIGSGAIVNYVHVDDVIRSLILCAKHDKSINNTYIVSQSTTLFNMVESIREGADMSRYSLLKFPEGLVRMVVRILNVVMKFPLTMSRIDALTNVYHYNSFKIENDLGFKYATSLEDRFVEFSSKLKE